MKRNKAKDLFKLANAFYENLSFREGGGLGVDGKRPFGNSSYTHDVLEIIGWEGEHRIDWYTQEQLEYARILYEEALPEYLKKMWKRCKTNEKNFQKRGK